MKQFVLEYKSKLNNFNAQISCLDFPNYIVTQQSNHCECIKFLYDYGMDLNEKLGVCDNNIYISGGTALHVAAYYKLNMWISLNANVNSINNAGQIIKNDLIIIKLIRNAYSNILLKDNYNRTPISYCTNTNKIKKILMNPLLLPSEMLAQSPSMVCDESIAKRIEYDVHKIVNELDDIAQQLTRIGDPQIYFQVLQSLNNRLNYH